MTQWSWFKLQTGGYMTQSRKWLSGHIRNHQSTSQSHPIPSHSSIQLCTAEVQTIIQNQPIFLWNEATSFWANYDNSLTWNLRSFWDSIPLNILNHVSNEGEQASVVIKFTQIQSWLFPLQTKVPKIVASSESKALRYRQILAKPAGFCQFVAHWCGLL